MLIIDRKKLIDYVPSISNPRESGLSISLFQNEGDIEIYKIEVPAGYKNQVIIQWKVAAKGVKGSWSSNAILDKRIRTDWEVAQLQTSISVDAPIISIYGQQDENLINYCISDAILESSLEASLREEDNHIYCTLTLLTQSISEEKYTTSLRISKESKHFSEVVQEAAAWIVEESSIIPHVVSDLAKVPLYSTWYAFHQSLDEDQLRKECQLATNLGMKLIIVDDGWQTMDDGRGYDYTGDWNPDRFKDMSKFVEDIHDLGMGVMLWYSVPFCGVKSKAYQRFKGKFLTENHHWAPVFDPRFPEVRKYLCEIYSSALIDWKIDGFKLDFIDDFKVYDETELNELNGRDTLSVAQGVKRLIDEISRTLFSIKPDVLIEFRQQYINPSLRKLGNMFRAFDCPNDSLMNRVRTTDTKLICGESAVHSDMLTWHSEEDVHVAALQFTSILFSVPQVSVRLHERSSEELKMIQHYLSYWEKNKSIFLNGKFLAHNPLSNYSMLEASNSEKRIIGLYQDVPVVLHDMRSKHEIINGKLSTDVLIKSSDTTKYKIRTFNCKGELKQERVLDLKKGVDCLSCPPNGILALTKLD